MPIKGEKNEKIQMRIVSVVLCLCMVLLSSMVSEASEKEDEKMQIYTEVDRLNPQDYIKTNAALVQRGMKARMQRGSKSLKLVHYYQGDEMWCDDIMLTQKRTIGNAGCCLTSFAMIQRFLGGMYNPRGVNNKLGNGACPFEYTTAASVFGFTISNYKYGTVVDDYAIEFIIGAIDSGYPVLVGLTPDDTSKNTHFVAAYGYSGDTIYINDPAGGRDYTPLSQYLSGYSVHRLYVYTK